MGYVAAFSRPCETMHCSVHLYYWKPTSYQFSIHILCLSKCNVICKNRSTLAKGRKPRTNPIKTDNYKPKAIDNQFIMFGATSGYLPKSKHYLGAKAWTKPSKPTTISQKQLTINLLYSVSRRVISKIEALSPGAKARTNPTKTDQDKPKATHFPPHQAKALFTWPNNCTDLTAKGQSHEQPKGDWEKSTWPSCCTSLPDCP